MNVDYDDTYVKPRNRRTTIGAFLAHHTLHHQSRPRRFLSSPAHTDSLVWRPGLCVVLWMLACMHFVSVSAVCVCACLLRVCVRACVCMWLGGWRVTGAFPPSSGCGCVGCCPPHNPTRHRRLPVTHGAPPAEASHREQRGRHGLLVTRGDGGFREHACWHLASTVCLITTHTDCVHAPNCTAHA
jgi:hypothetical protein